MSVFDPERAALILVDALYLGDKEAAVKWGITTRTVENHRARLATDAHFSALFSARRRAAEKDWRGVRLKTLRKGLTKLEALIDMADTPEHIPAVTGAVKVLGELQVTSEALSVDSGDDSEGQQPQEDAGGDAGLPGPH